MSSPIRLVDETLSKLLWSSSSFLKTASRALNTFDHRRADRFGEAGKAAADRAAVVAQAEPVFVLSTGRTGTMTLASLAHLSHRVDAHHEPAPNLLELSFLYHQGFAATLGEPFFVDAVAAARDYSIATASHLGRVYFESNNRMSLLVPVLRARYPRAKLISMHRHPYEFIRSGMRRGYYVGHTWDHARLRPLPGTPAAERWSSMSQLAKIAWLWSETNDVVSEALEAMPADRCWEMRYDTFFADWPSYVEKFFHFVAGIAPPSKRAMESVMGRTLNAQKGGHFPPPKEWSDAWRIEVDQIVGPTARRLGYDIAG